MFILLAILSSCLRPVGIASNRFPAAALAAEKVGFGGIAPSPQNFESFPQASSNSLGILVVVHASVSFG
jgi:hypothetical protein